MVDPRLPEDASRSQKFHRPLIGIFTPAGRAPSRLRSNEILSRAARDLILPRVARLPFCAQNVASRAPVAIRASTTSPAITR
jgi:hypothetical protein